MPMKKNFTEGEAVPPGNQAGRREIYNRSEFSNLLDMEVVEARPGFARVVMDPQGKRNHRGFIHGGAIFSLADQAFAAAANAGEIREVALSAQISYIRPAKGALTAIAELVSEDGDHSLYRVRVFEADLLVATLEGVGIRVREEKT